MIDYSTYRRRIGLFNPSRGKKNISISSYKNDDQYGRAARPIFNFTLKLVLVLCLIFSSKPSDTRKTMSVRRGVTFCFTPLTRTCRGTGSEGSIEGWWGNFGSLNLKQEQNCNIKTEIIDYNFIARITNGNIQGKKGIINMHLNIRSLKYKVGEVKRLIKEHNPHMLGLSEVELSKENVDESSLKVPGYEILFPTSWTRQGTARVVVYVKKTFKYEQVLDLQDDQVQTVWVKGRYQNTRNIYFCHSYREHLTRQNSRTVTRYMDIFLGQWEDATRYGNSPEPNEVHICGDMNIDVLEGRWLEPDYPLAPLSRRIKSVCDTNNFHQLVKDVTRTQYNSVTNTTSLSCLDHIYTNSKFRCSDPVVTSFGDSDHDLIGYVRYSKNPPVPARIICKRSYKDFIKEDFLNDVRNTDWSDVFACTEVDMATECFTRKFRYLLNLHAPWARVQQRKNFAPWLTSETKELMKKRDIWKEKAKNLARHSSEVGPDQVAAWAEYKKYRNKVNNKKKGEEIAYKSERFKEIQDSSDLVWRTAKSFMGWKGSGTPTQLQVNHELVTSPRKIAQYMNEYFLEKVSKIRTSMPPSEMNTSKIQSMMVDKNSKLEFRHITVHKVRKLLKGLSNSRSTGVDELDNFSVKLAADYIAHPLHHIVTLSLLQQQFPSAWKSSKVLPLHKKGELLERKNYRPVAILSPLSKILEKVVFEELYSYFHQNQLFHPSLHGYRKHRSTQTALLQLYDRWVRAASSGQLSGVVLLDLSAAFDLVDPQLLLQKLQLYGADAGVLAWLESYLTGRQQAVWIDSAMSDFLASEVGVPQGSNLGPLLFLIFYNDLPNFLSCDVEAYADDTTISVAGSTVEEISRKLTTNCQAVSQWMQGNKLKLNADKTHLMTVGTSRRLQVQVEKVDVVMDDCRLGESDEQHETLLGCIIEPGLKWHKQVNHLISKLRSRLTGLEHLRQVIPYRVRKNVTQGIFTSMLVYCLPVFGGLDKYEIESLQVMQNKAARLVTHSPLRAHRRDIFNQIGWLTVNQLIFFHSALTVYRIRKSREPEYLNNLLSRDNARGNMVVDNTKLSLAKNSFSYRSSSQWNKIPTSIRNNPKISFFKKNLKDWILVNIAQFVDA